MAEVDGESSVSCLLVLYGCSNRHIAGRDTSRGDLKMTSEDRRRARYQRRSAARMEKKIAHCGHADRFETVFSYGNLYESYKKCRRNVSWKASVQKYIANAPLNVYLTHKKLMDGKYKSSGFYDFDVRERGKTRHIRSVTVGERVVQRCLCDNALVPMLSRIFVYDNCASLENRGYSFAIRRICQHLQEHFREHGTEGYILLFDFKRFFDNVSHAVIKGILKKQFTDHKIIALTEHFVDAFGDVGLGLGSQISQVFALASADRLDHYTKEILRIRGYGRYMDDGYLIHHNKDYLRRCLNEISEICKQLGITLNQKKTQIVKLSHGFTWLKVRFFLTSTGKVVRKIYRRSVTKQRQKIKRLHRKFLAGEIAFEGCYTSMQSWVAYAKTFDAYHTIQNMCSLFDSLFIFPMTDAVYRKGDVSL